MSRPFVSVTFAVALLVAPVATHARSTGGALPARPAVASVVGTLVEHHGDTFHGGALQTHFHVDTGAETIRVTADQVRGVAPGTRVRVTRGSDGTASVRPAAADAKGTTVAATASADAELPPPPGPTRLAVVLTNFATDARRPWTPEAVDAAYFTSARSVAKYYAEESYGKLAISGSVYGWYTIAADRQSCDYLAWADLASSAATNAGVDLAGFTNVAFVFPRQSACGWAGLATLPGTESWINGDISLRTTAHELGHNFGVHHAATTTCFDANGARVAMSTTCRMSEYGDPFDLMGSAATRHANNWHRAEMGFVSPTHLRTITLNGTYTVGVAQRASANGKVVRVERADGRYLALEYRQPHGTHFDAFASTDPVVRGVSIRIVRPGELAQSLLVDTSPSTATFADAPLLVGKTFVDGPGKVTVTTTAVSSTAATVRITIGSANDTRPPTAPARPVVSASGGTAATVTWGASTDDSRVAGYRVYRSGQLIRTTSRRELSSREEGLTPAMTYTWTVAAFDAANNVSTPSAVTIRMPDTIAPTAPSSVAARAVGLSDADVSWSAATDNVAVAHYVVYRGSTAIATTTQRVVRDTGLVAGFRYEYRVRAVDAAGNTGPAASVSFTMSPAIP